MSSANISHTFALLHFLHFLCTKTLHISIISSNLPNRTIFSGIDAYLEVILNINFGNVSKVMGDSLRKFQKTWYEFQTSLNFGDIYLLRNSASSFHWLSSCIFSCSFGRSFVPHRWHLLSSPLYDASEHTNHIISVRIWSWQHVSVNISSVAELSPVYCCLVSFFSHFYSASTLILRFLMDPGCAGYHGSAA